MSPSLSVVPHRFETKAGGTLECELGTFEVPEERARPDRTLKLSFLRLRAKAAAPLSPVVFLSGGPGDSGIHWAKYPQFLKAFQRIQDVADVILLDQRGCGQSEPDAFMLTIPAPIPPGCLRSEAEMFAFYEVQGRQNVDRLAENGLALQGYNVLESADDLADLRDAVGAEKISLIGYSYGSHLALNTIKRHEDILDKVVLCGWEGPDDTLKMPSNVQRQIEKLAALARSQAVCNDLVALMEEVHSATKDHAVALEVPFPGAKGHVRLEVGRFALQHVAAGWMGVSNRFGALPKLYREVREGTLSELARAVGLLIRGWSRQATFYLTDGASSASPARLARIRQEAPSCVLENAANFPFPEIASVYGAKDLGPQFWEPVATELPVLVVNGTLDGNTPAEQAGEQLKRCRNGMQHIIENAAHNDMLLPVEVHEAIVEFLERGETTRLKSSLPEPVFER